MASGVSAKESSDREGKDEEGDGALQLVDFCAQLDDYTPTVRKSLSGL